MFHRKIEAKILDYIEEKDGPILIVNGARQIGKSFIIRHVCKQHVKHFIEINLADDSVGARQFEKVKTITDFYFLLSALYGSALGGHNDTLVFLDEIQVYPHLLSMLKPLRADDKYRYIVSGSLLGLTMKHTFIPMGSVIEEKMYPMDFEEFLWASGVGQEAIDYLRDCFLNLSPINEGLHAFFLKKFKEYLLCGGLPDAVKAFLNGQNIAKVRTVHEMIYSGYRDDASKYDSEHRLKIERIYSSLVSYMENKAKRIMAKRIEGVEYASLVDYEDEFDYLISSGIALGVDAISDPKYPLSQSISKNLIKLYYNDVGLLTYLLFKRDIDSILWSDSGANLGSVYETAAAMELAAHGHQLFYFDSKKVGEVDFLVNDYESFSALPIEIKSGVDQRNFRAIPKLVNPDGNYKLPLGYIFGNQNILKKDDNLITMPIYMIMFL